MQIIAVQTDISWQDKPANHDRIRALLSEQPIEKNALIVLPEMFDTGFSMQLSATAQTAARESEGFLREIAQQHQAAVLAGVVGPVSAGRGSNEAIAVSPDGSELVRYQKMQPFTLVGEQTKYRAGNHHCLFTWNGLKIAPFVCYDLRFPELFRPAARDGAELFIVIANWPAVRSEHWVRLLQARAIENQAFAIGVNRCGTDPTLRYDGRSTAFDPLGTSLFEADEKEQVITLNIEASAARRWRSDFPALQDIRPGLFD